MGDTEISWTHRPGTRGRTWNPTQGCRRVSPGCEHCYAERLAARFAESGWSQGLINIKTRKWNGEARLADHKLSDPLKWRDPSTVFVNSMSDLFYEGFSNEQIAAVFGVMAACPQHTFQILTKRAKRMREWFKWIERESRVCNGGVGMHPAARCFVEAQRQADTIFDLHGRPTTMSSSRAVESALAARWPLPNVWLGVSVENQEAADERIPELLETPAAVRFLSCEPLIGPVDLSKWFREGGELGRDNPSHANASGGGHVRSGESPATGNVAEPQTGTGGSTAPVARPLLSWVIAGCESGPGARACSVEWLRLLRDQCAEAGVAFFLKQAIGTDEEDQHGQPFVHGQHTYLDGHPLIPKYKAGGVIVNPFLDGSQHVAFPKAA